MTLEPWRIDRFWEGQTAVILGGGPSLTLKQVRHVAMRRLENKCRVIAVNDSIFPAWWADWLHGCDEAWWNRHRLTVTKFTGIKTSCVDTLPPQWGVKFLRYTGEEGFDDDPSAIRSGGNGGYQAVHASVHAGVNRLILLGFDMKPNGHWFGKHDAPMYNPDISNVGRWLRYFETLVVPLRVRKIEIINATPESGLTQWPFSHIEHVL